MALRWYVVHAYSNFEHHVSINAVVYILHLKLHDIGMPAGPFFRRRLLESVHALRRFHTNCGGAGSHEERSVREYIHR